MKTAKLSLAPPPLEAAQAVRNKLRFDLDAARASLADIDVKRKELSFAAHTEGGEAKVTLDKLNRERADHVANIESLETAHVESSRRVDEAERDEALAADAVKAERALVVADELRTHGEQIDAALSALVDAANAYQARIDELNVQLGVTHANPAQLEAMVTRVLRTALSFSPMRPAIEFIAPGERRTMADVANGHAAAIERAVEPRLPQREAAQ